MERIAIAVIELCDESGTITPIAVVKDGKEYRVDKVLGVTRHAPDVACVSPMKYDCIIEGHKRAIYRDGYPSQKWFSVCRCIPRSQT